MQMKGITISTKEGAAQDSIIKLNYIFTIANEAIIKTVFHLSANEKKLVFEELSKRLDGFKA